MAMSMSLLSKSKFLIGPYRNLYLASGKYSTKPATQDKTPDAVPPETEEYDAPIPRKMHQPNALERRVLVWTGRYKSGEVPDEVTQSTMEKARNKARIKVANYMMAGTLVGCVIMIISGKRAAERGETLTKINKDWHAEMNKRPA